MNLQLFLQQKFESALSGLASDPAKYAALVKPAQDAKHGDYQANCAMSLAKELGRKPVEVRCANKRMPSRRKTVTAKLINRDQQDIRPHATYSFMSRSVAGTGD